MSDRREFLRSITLGTAGLYLAKPEVQKWGTANNLPNIGIITNTLKNEMQEDYISTLRVVAEIGYSYIEGSVPDGVSPTEYRKYLDDTGLTSVALGSSMGQLQENLDEILKTAKTLNSRYVVCYWPWLSSAENLDKKEVIEAAERINKIGKIVHKAGFRFAWHNHDKEFVDINGKSAFDIIMEHTDPAYSTVQLDWYWVFKGGGDPVELFKRYPGRFELAHVKDMNNNRDRGITCVGNGIIDFKRIFEHAATGGTQYVIVENERAIEGIQCARESYNHISNILI